MTAALQAIGATPAEPTKSASEPQISKKSEGTEEVSESKKSPLAQKKADILKRLNAKVIMVMQALKYKQYKKN